MDVTFVLEESGVTATVEVPCEADVAAAKEVACTALAVSPASVEMRIGTQVLEGTCRLQDTAFDAGVQVVLARPRLADIKCPAQYSTKGGAEHLSLSRCGTLCIYREWSGHVGGFDTETFDTVFSFKVHTTDYGETITAPPAISQCKTRCYLACGDDLRMVALPGGEVLRKVDDYSHSVFACGGVVASKGKDGVSVYDEDLTLLRFLPHECMTLRCMNIRVYGFAGLHVERWLGHMALSDCGGWVITSSLSENNVRLWDVNTGVAVACVPIEGSCYAVALSSSAAVFAVGVNNLYDWSGAALRSVDVDSGALGMQFTPCGKYLVVKVFADDDVEHDDGDGDYDVQLHQYDVATMSCVRVLPPQSRGSFAISPCSRVVVVMQPDGVIVTKHLYPHNVDEEDFWKKDSVVARDMLLHEHGIDVASPLPACSYPSSTFEYHLEHILKNDNPDQLDLLLRSKLDGSTGLTLQRAVQCAAHRCVDVMLDGFERSPDDTAHALRSSASHCWGHEDTPGKVLCVLRILRHCREQGVVVDQPQILQDTFKGLISSSAAHPKLCQLLMRMGAAVTLDVILSAHDVHLSFLQSCDISPDILLTGPSRGPAGWATLRNLDVVRSLHASWCKRVDPDGDEDAQWYRTMSHVALSGRCADERIVKRIFDLAVQLNARRCRALPADHAQHSPSVIGASRVNSVFCGNSEGPLCESPCDPGCRCITCLDEERYTGRRFCLGGGGGGGWRKAPAVVRAQRKARIAQQMSRAAQRCRRQR